MPGPVSWVIESALPAPREVVWAWITDLRCIRRETMPVLAMTAPAGVRTLTDGAVVPGRRLFRSVLLLGGVLPVDVLDLTLVALWPGRGFVERSPMRTMRRWEHRREILDGANGGVVLRDTLTVEPRVARALTLAFVRRFFAHRHRRLRRAFASPAGGA